MSIQFTKISTLTLALNGVQGQSRKQKEYKTLLMIRPGILNTKKICMLTFSSRNSLFLKPLTPQMTRSSYRTPLPLPLGLAPLAFSWVAGLQNCLLWHINILYFWTWLCHWNLRGNALLLRGGLSFFFNQFLRSLSWMTDLKILQLLLSCLVVYQNIIITLQIKTGNWCNYYSK